MLSPRPIFSQLFEKIGNYLSKDMSQGGDARALLLAETKALRAHLRETMKAYDASLNEVQKALEQDKNQELSAKAEGFKALLHASRRALYRIVLTQQDKQSLHTELNEWKQHKTLSQDAQSDIRHERMEMLESEIRTRQVYKIEVQELPKRIESYESPDISQEPQLAESIVVTSVGQQLPNIELWKSLQPSPQDIEHSWTIVLQKAFHPRLDPKASFELMKAFKQAQGTIKQTDKRHGISRNRIAIFETLKK